jgi:hypothetical protein
MPMTAINRATRTFYTSEALLVKHLQSLPYSENTAFYEYSERLMSSSGLRSPQNHIPRFFPPSSSPRSTIPVSMLCDGGKVILATRDKGDSAIKITLQLQKLFAEETFRDIINLAQSL